jgi:hypothetical protein
MPNEGSVGLTQYLPKPSPSDIIGFETALGDVRFIAAELFSLAEAA